MVQLHQYSMPYLFINCYIYRLYKSDTNSVTTINTGTTFDIIYNGSNTAAANLWSTTAAGIDLSIHVNSVSNFTEYYMFIDKCPTN
jgi:hypothetical protein